MSIITDYRGRRAVSNLGWVDHGAVWSFGAGDDEPRTIPLSDAKYLDLLAGKGPYFAAVHHWSGERLAITVQPYDQPGQVVGRIDVGGWQPTITGDEAVWEGVPLIFRGYLNHDVTGDAGYFTVRRFGPRVELNRLDWFDAGGYDHVYQSVVSAIEVPESGDILFGVQRSSELVLFDPFAATVVRRIGLAERHGNPRPVLSAFGPAGWAIDYDTVVLIDRATWQVTKAVRLQDAAQGTAMFLGDLWVPYSEEVLVVPRPGSGDVPAAPVPPQPGALAARRQQRRPRAGSGRAIRQ
jgi:hypothetical protein